VSSIIRQEIGGEPYQGVILSQRLSIDRAIYVRQVVLDCSFGSVSNPAEFWIEFRTEPNGGGALIGTASESRTAGFPGQPISLSGWIVFSWTAPPLLPSHSDVWMTAVSSTGTDLFLWNSGTTAGGTLFQDDVRCAYFGPTALPDNDFVFKLYTTPGPQPEGIGEEGGEMLLGGEGGETIVSE
jgi:hypothetical protein